MMDPFAELERMAMDAKTNDNSAFSDDEPSLEQVANWQRIFHYSRTQAISKIKEHRANIARPSISDELWNSMQTRLKGYDREAYEHELLLDHQSSFKSASPTTDESFPNNALILFKLGKARLNEPLSTISEIQNVAQMSSTPNSFTGVDEDDDEATFCQLDATAKKHISSYLANIESRFQPTIIAYSRAKKDLSAHSAYPTLGLDTTLPQHRLQTENDFALPKQGQYPVPYFFYGTLADPEILTRILNLRHSPTFQPATITGGVIKTWAQKFKALVDGPSAAQVDGWAYRVDTEEQELALRIYETAKYEVVRCVIVLEDGTKEPGCTFRFTDATALT